MIRNQEDDEFVAVRVQDPRMQNEGSWNSYVDYKIFLHTNSKAFTAKTSCVRRRYSEFAWLKKKLQKNSGLVPVPELPGKSFFFYSNEDFLERRRKGLQAFLDNVVNMTVCLSDSQLHLFLQTQLPVGHIQDCVQGHTPYSVTDAILTYASSNRGYAQAQEEDSIKEPSLTVSYESMESPAPHQPFLQPKEIFSPDLLSCGDSDPLEGSVEVCDTDTVGFQQKEQSSVQVLQKNNHLEAVVEDCVPTEVTFFLGDIQDAPESLRLTEQTQQRSCQIQTPVEVHLPMGSGFEENGADSLMEEECLREESATTLDTEEETVPQLDTEEETVPQPDTEEKTVPQLDTEEETVPQLDTEEETVPQLDTEEETVLQPDTEEETVPQLDTEEETVPQLDTEEETVPQLDTEEETVPQPDTEEETVPQLDTEEETVPQPDTEEETVPQPDTEEETVPQLDTEEETVPQLDTEEETVPQLDTEEETVPQPDTEEKTVPQLDTEEETVPQLDTEEKTVFQPDTEEKTVPQPDTEKETVPQPDTEEKTVPQPDTEKETVPQPDTEEETVPQPDTEEETVPQPDTEEETVLQPDTEEETVLQPDTEEETVLQPDTEEETVPQPDTEEETVPQPDPEEETVPQPDTEEETVPQPDTEEETVPQLDTEEKTLPKPDTVQKSDKWESSGTTNMEEVEFDSEKCVSSAAVLDFMDSDFKEQETDIRSREEVLEVVCSERQDSENHEISEANSLEHVDSTEVHTENATCLEELKNSGGQKELDQENSESESKEETPLQSETHDIHSVLEVESSGGDIVQQMDQVEQGVDLVGTKDDSDEDSRSSSNDSIVKVSDEESICDDEDSTLAANGFMKTSPEEVVPWSQGDTSSGNILDLHVNGHPVEKEDVSAQEDEDLHYITDITDLSTSLDLNLTVAGGDLSENSDFSILESSCRPVLADGKCTEQNSLSLEPSEDTHEVEVR